MSDFPLQIHLDEIGFRKSFERFSGETAESFRERLRAEAAAPTTSDQNSLKEKLGNWLGTTSKVIGGIQLRVDSDGEPFAEDPRVILSHNTLSFYFNYENGLTEKVFDLTDPTDGYFLSDIKTYLDTSTYFQPHRWNSIYNEERSSLLVDLDTEKHGRSLSQSSVRPLGKRYVKSIRPRTSGRFLNEVSPDSIEQEGDYAVDLLTGVVWTYGEEREVIDFIFADFPILLKWNPFKLTEATDLSFEEVKMLSSERYWGE